MNITCLSGQMNRVRLYRIKQVEILECGRINEVAVLTEFSYHNIYGRLSGTKKSGRSNEVMISTS